MTKSERDPSIAFGYRQVRSEEKQSLVNEVFSKVAAQYDKMNDLMSGGLHRLWKDAMASQVNPPKEAGVFTVLDVAGGTGDIAFRIAELGGPEACVTIADISPGMVAEGKKRWDLEKRKGLCRFTVGNAELLAFPPQSFDAYTVAFGMRNLTHIDRALAEAFRVLKPGGQFLCLEFSQVDVPLLDSLYDAYSFAVIPAIGKAVTGDGQPYRYLVESIRTFPKPEAFKKMIEGAGFNRVTYRILSGGIAAIHTGWRL